MWSNPATGVISLESFGLWVEELGRAEGPLWGSNCDKKTRPKALGRSSYLQNRQEKQYHAPATPSGLATLSLYRNDRNLTPREISVMVGCGGARWALFGAQEVICKGPKAWVGMSSCIRNS